MAVNIELIQHRNIMSVPGGAGQPIPVLPENAITNIAAVGATTLTAGTKIVTVRNRTAGDSSLIKVQLASSSATASAANGIQLAAGQSYTFALPKGVDASLYEIDVRAG